MSPIVVGYDGSDCARAALKTAVEFAGAFGDEVHVVVAYEVHRLGGEVRDLAAALAEQANTIVRLAIDQAGGLGAQVQSEIVEARAAEALVKTADRLAARLIVVGTRGESSAPRRPRRLHPRSWARPGSSRCCDGCATAWPGPACQVESAKGECNLGQQEIAFRYADAVTTCDNHSIYKTGSKEIADQEGMSLTFMAKPNAREGNSCHIHLSARTRDGKPVMAGDGPHGLSPSGEHFIAGQLAALPELRLCYAPNINSYKRYVPGSFAPTSVRWGMDNRTCALRLVGHGRSLRPENRAPGGDVNPYLAVAAMIAAGLYGRTTNCRWNPPAPATRTTITGGRAPTTLRDVLQVVAHSPSWPGGVLNQSLPDVDHDALTLVARISQREYGFRWLALRRPPGRFLLARSPPTQCVSLITSAFVVTNLPLPEAHPNSKRSECEI